MIHIWRPWKLSNFQDSPLPCSSTSKILPPPWPWLPILNYNQMTTNRLKENIQGWLLDHVLPSGLVFRGNLLIFSGIPLTSFPLAEASLSSFSRFYALCVQLSKNITKCLLFVSIHVFSTHFAVSFFYLHNLRT